MFKCRRKRICSIETLQKRNEIETFLKWLIGAVTSRSHTAIMYKQEEKMSIIVSDKTHTGAEKVMLCAW